MCLCITSKAKLYRAKKPILVYKLLYINYDSINTYHSPYMGAIYTPRDMKRSLLARETIAYGGGIGRGLHSYARKRPYRVLSDGTLKPCVIPKGAYFIIGDFCGDVSIASTHLMLLPQGKDRRFKPLNVKDHQAVRPVSDFGHWIVR